MSQNNGTANGRDDRGRFTKGNTCGRGNPFARQTAQLRKAAVDMVSEEDIRGIMAVLLLKAKGGDLAAAKLVLAYGIGRPTEAENPDRLDANEWQLWREKAVEGEQVSDWMKGAPIDYFNRVASILLDCRTQTYAREYDRQWQRKHPEEYEQYMQSKAREQEPAPSPNGGNGDQTGMTAPSTNGDNGDDPCGPVGRPDHNRGPSANGDNGASSGPARRPVHNRGRRPAHHREQDPGPSGNGDNGANASGPVARPDHDRGVGQSRSAPSINGDNGRDQAPARMEGGTRNGQAEPGKRRGGTSHRGS